MRRFVSLAALLALGAALPAAAQTGCPPHLNLERIESRIVGTDRGGEPMRGHFAVFFNSGGTSTGVRVTRGPVEGVSGQPPTTATILAPGRTHLIPVGTSVGTVWAPESAIRAAQAYGCRV
ncbi:MAG: hypothetical protein K2X11_12035 [Acetobacteraceae bacterium]|nr:hypothetical protein [Acetobacteraceae bacterium]